LFVSAAFIAYRSLPELGSWKAIATRVLAVPIGAGLFYLALASGGGTAPISASDAIAAGASVGAINAAIAASVLIAHDRFESTLPYLAIASHGRAAAWAGRLTLVTAIGTIAGVVTTVVALSIAGEQLPLESWAAVTLVLLLASASAIGLGFLLGAVSLRLSDSLLLANVAEYALPLICGAVAPLSVFPNALAACLRWIPPAGAVEAGRALANEGIGHEFWFDLVVSASSGILILIAGTVIWHFLERQARRDGSIESLSI
jgi:ABC-2 type transport system permease protein